MCAHSNGVGGPLARGKSAEDGKQRQKRPDGPVGAFARELAQAKE